MQRNVTIRHYASAGYPAVAISTSDEDRAIRTILTSFPKMNVLKIAFMDSSVAA